MARDRVSELMSIKERAGRDFSPPSEYDLTQLEITWHEKLKGISPADELVPIRIVTILEVFGRRWIGKLINFGAPYVERAAKLKVDVKYDFAIASSLQGGAVTLGDVVAHSVSLNAFEQYIAVFSALTDSKFLDLISETKDRMAVETEGESAQPIIGSVDELAKTLSRLFEVRHVLVHELPSNKPHSVDEVSGFIRSAKEFVAAADEQLTQALYGLYPVSQQAMNLKAIEASEAADAELAAVCAEAEKIDWAKPLATVQRAWEEYRDAEAEREASAFEGGTMQPLIYFSAREEITRERIKALKAWTETNRIPLPAIEELPFNAALLTRIDSLGLSVHSANFLQSENFMYVGDLVHKTEGEMLRLPNFGRKSLDEIKGVLAKLGLHLGMEEPGWPPKDIKALAEAYAAQRAA
jgi:uncharacterized protein YecT (DUF1311 family)